MNLADQLIITLAAVLFGNFITVTFFYAIWRIKRNERDRAAIGLALFCLLAIGAVGFGLRDQLSAERTAQEHSERSSPPPLHPAKAEMLRERSQAH